jgi:hypothetical protein
VISGRFVDSILLDVVDSALYLLPFGYIFTESSRLLRVRGNPQFMSEIRTTEVPAHGILRTATD